MGLVRINSKQVFQQRAMLTRSRQLYVRFSWPVFCSKQTLFYIRLCFSISPLLILTILCKALLGNKYGKAFFPSEIDQTEYLNLVNEIKRLQLDTTYESSSSNQIKDVFEFFFELNTNKIPHVFCMKESNASFTNQVRIHFNKWTFGTTVIPCTGMHALKPKYLEINAP